MNGWRRRVGVCLLSLTCVGILTAGRVVPTSGVRVGDELRGDGGLRDAPAGAQADDSRDGSAGDGGDALLEHLLEEEAMLELGGGSGVLGASSLPSATAVARALDTWGGSLASDALRSAAVDMESFDMTVFVDVKLVGFDGSGNARAVMDAKTLRGHLDTLRTQHLRQAVLHPGKSGRRELRVRHDVVYRVSHASRHLSTQISDLVRTGVIEQHRTMLPVAELEELLSPAFHSSALSATFFVLNPTLAESEDSQDRSHDQKEDVDDDMLEAMYGDVDVIADAADAAAAANEPPLHKRRYWWIPDPATSCPTTVGVATARYAWVDVTAGPLVYGPRTSGDGVVTDESIPRLVSPKDGSIVGGFVPRIAAFVHQSTLELMTPAMHRFPARYSRRVHIRIVEILDEDRPEEKGSTLGSYQSLVAPLKEVGQRTEEDVRVTRSQVLLHDCSVCMLALSSSRRAFTSAAVAAGVSTTVHEYVDSLEMARWLRMGSDEDWGAPPPRDRDGQGGAAQPDGGVDEPDQEGVLELGPILGDPDEEAVIPVFVYKLDTPDALLLDRFHQAVAVLDPDAGAGADAGDEVSSDDVEEEQRGRTAAETATKGAGWSEARGGMVVAVVTQAEPQPSDWVCNGVSRETNPADARRAVLASVLELGWAVSPTHIAWHAVHKRAMASYTWATGRTPFGALSDSMELSYALTDAAARNVLYSSIEIALEEAATLLHRLQGYTLPIVELLSHDDFAEFVRRWVQFRHRLARAGTFAALHDFRHARAYLSALQRDLAVMRALAHRAGRNLHSDLVCPDDEPVAPSVAARIVVVLAALGITMVACVCLAWHKSRAAANVAMRRSAWRMGAAYPRSR